MKRLFYTFIFLTFIIALPLYGAGRLLLPNIVTDKIVENLPANTKLEIGNYYSRADLAIVYENIKFSNDQFDAVIKELVVEPNPNFKNPLILSFPYVSMNIGGNQMELQNSIIRVLLGKNKINDIKLNGSIGTLDSTSSAVVSNIEFLLQGFLSTEKNLLISSEVATFKLSLPLGSVGVTFDTLSADIKMNNGLKSIINAKVVELDLAGLQGMSSPKIFKAESLNTEISFVKMGTWSSPLNLSANTIFSNDDPIFEKVSFSALGEWGEKSQECDFSELQRKMVDCDKLIHLKNIHLILTDGAGLLDFKGDGFCIAPRSGCRQRIIAQIMSRDTTEIFSKIMRSGTINPLVGGILIGSLLSSPLVDDAPYDHSINLEVKGSQIFINGEPLIK